MWDFKKVDDQQIIGCKRSVDRICSNSADCLPSCEKERAINLIDGTLDTRRKWIAFLILLTFTYLSSASVQLTIYFTCSIVKPKAQS